MPDDTSSSFRRVLDPIDRISEVLFGLIMVLTATLTLSVATAGRAEVKAMVLAALGCNLAWGIIDAGLYLMESLAERGRNLLTMRAIVQTNDPETARQVLADALPPRLAAVLSPSEIDSIRQRLLQHSELAPRPRLTKDEWLGGLGICLIVFLSTIPVVVPFFLTDNVLPALRMSNAIAVAMMFACGYAFARYTGLRPWPTGLVMIAIGCALVAVAILLGG
jgi:VIT family